MSEYGSEEERWEDLRVPSYEPAALSDFKPEEGEPKQGVRPHLVGRDRLVQARKEAPGFEGVRGRLHRVEERREMTAATAPGAARGRAREGASRRKELEDDHDQEH